MFQHYGMIHLPLVLALVLSSLPFPAVLAWGAAAVESAPPKRTDLRLLMLNLLCLPQRSTDFAVKTTSVSPLGHTTPLSLLLLQPALWLVCFTERTSPLLFSSLSTTNVLIMCHFTLQIHNPPTVKMPPAYSELHPAAHSSLRTHTVDNLITVS